MRASVGYSGGTTARPTYRTIGDHAEALQVDYDPTQTTYEALLALFWASHEPTRQAYSRQYMSAVFAHDEAQLRAALESRERYARAAGRPVFTEVAPLGSFDRAEGYHQKYYLRKHSELMRAFVGYTEQQFVDSRVAARLNGYAAGDGDPALLASELESYGLATATHARLRAAVLP